MAVDPDGVTFIQTTSVLLFNQTNPEENGIYEVGVVGVGVAPITRVTDMDEVAEVIFGWGVLCSGGTLYTDHYFIVTDVPAVIDVDPLIIKDISNTSTKEHHAQDGVYVVGVVGGGTAALTRATDMNTAAEAMGAVVHITAGTTNINKDFCQMTTTGVTLGTTPLNFVDGATLLPTGKNLPGDTMEHVDGGVYSK
jgi:hypothetical protein